MKRLLFFLSLLFCCVLGAATPQEIQAQMDAIQSQPQTYYFGYAQGRQRKETNAAAVQELMSQIYMVIDAETTTRDSADEAGYTPTQERKVRIYTGGRLPEVQTLCYKKGPDFAILRYILRSEYQKIFDNKKKEVIGFLRDAEENLKTNQLGKSFRNFYRAAVAIEGLPEGCIRHDGRSYTPEILFHRIRDIARDITFKVVENSFSDLTRRIVLDIRYKGSPVNDLNIYYYDLHAYISQKTNTNLMEIPLYGEEYRGMKTLNVKIDVKEELYNSYSQQTRNLSALFDCEDLEIIREIPLKKRHIKPVKPKKRVHPELNVTFTNAKNCDVLDAFAANLATLFTMLDAEYLDNESIFTDETIVKRMQQVIDCNHTKLLSYPQQVVVHKTDTGWEARQFGVSVSCEGFPTRNETVVIDFDETGKIYNFCYTINPALHELFETKGVAAGDWDYRQIAIKFLENYKTSYTTKNVEDVETLYSEDAIIITGKVFKRTKADREIQPDLPAEEIIYLKQTKQEHLQRMKSIFRNNRFVWLQFDTFNITVSPVEQVYGVSMHQNYFSSNYQDEGYLFLLIDFRGEQPLIHVRNWQPGEWDLARQMKLDNIKFH
jgi:hypothetical protein